jgi:hypothetical protein
MMTYRSFLLINSASLLIESGVCFSCQIHIFQIMGWFVECLVPFEEWVDGGFESLSPTGHIKWLPKVFHHWDLSLRTESIVFMGFKSVLAFHVKLVHVF